MSVEKLLAEFLQEHPVFCVSAKSSADDIDNILKQRDLLLLLQDAYDLGHSDGYDSGYGVVY